MSKDSTSSRRRRWLVIAAAGTLIAPLSVWLAPSSLAVHDNGMFELDGNTVHDSATAPPYDWNSLFDASGNRIVTPDPNNGPLLADSFLSDSATPDNTYFKAGKDINPIASGAQHWTCAPANNPLDKDELLNSYAALIQVPANAPDNAGDNVLYLGSERKSNNGTSFAGFWLLKDNNVGCSGTNDFSGQHMDGDILIISNYTNGGGSQDVTAYRWTGNDASGSLVQIASLSGGVCSGGASNDDSCAIANMGTITTPWSPTSHDMNTFVETGVDMNALLGQAGGCFTTFLAETRSSDVTTADLKDFAGGSFNTCPPPPIVTTASGHSTLNAPGSAQHDTATISAVGNRPAPTGSISFFLCQPSEVTTGGCEGTAGTQIGSGVTIVNGSATSTPDASGADTTTLGKYCWRAEYAPDAAGALNYVASSETNATTECFDIVKGNPTLTTQIAVTGTHPGALGLSTLGDTATLTGVLGTPDAQHNTVNFTLYGPFATGVTPTCTLANQAATATGTLVAGAPGTFTATASPTFDPTEAGFYVWTASWDGDALNNKAGDQCNEATEKTEIKGAQIDVTKAANPPGPVNAGESIGFDLTVTNEGDIPALGVHVHDALPAGADGVPGGNLVWALDPPYTGCTITGVAGSQVLDCTFTQVDGPGSLPVIHISSSTSQSDCGVVKNKATITTTNGTGTDSDFATVTVNCPHLIISKTPDHQAPVTVGTPIGFTVTVTNNGAGSATGVLLDDPLPTGPGITWTIDVANTSGPLNCSITVADLQCTGTLGAGASETVHVTSPTEWTKTGDTTTNSCLGGPGGDGVYPNTAQVTATNVTGAPNASATETVVCPDLHILKTADAAEVNVGTNIGFTVTASNTGAGSATGALINDPLPAGVTWTIDAAGTSGPLTCGIASGTLTCTGTLGAGATEIVHITAPTSSAADCHQYNNTATLTATNDPQAPQSGDSTTVLCADVHVVKTADHNGTPVDVGSPIGFTVTVTNAGQAPAAGVDVEDPLPSGPGISWSVDSSTGPLTCSVDGTAPNQTLKCSGTLAASGDAGDVQTVHITSSTVNTADISSCGSYDNTATVTWTFAPGTPSSSKVTETVVCPDLNLTKTADDATVSAGDQIGFTVELENAGPGGATDVAINDPLPAGPVGSDVSWAIDTQTIDDVATDTCAITGAVGAQVLACGPIAAPNGFDLDVHIVSSTTKVDCGDYDNTATFTSTNSPGGDASASTSVLCPNLKVDKTADAGDVADTEPIGFTVTVTNDNGLEIPIGRATEVSLSDPLPLGPAGSDISYSIDSQQVNGSDVDACKIVTVADPASQTLECTFGDLQPGDVATVHVTSNTSFVDCGTFDNTATASASNADPVEASASTQVTCPADSLIVVADAPIVAAGDPIGFTLTGANAAVVITPTAATAKATTRQRGLTSTASALQNLAAAAVVPGSVLNAVLKSNLPSDSGVDWSIDPAYAGQGTCGISGSVGSQVLTCDVGTMLPDSQFSVHIMSATTCDTEGTFTDKGVLSSSNVPDVTSQDTTRVTACAVIIHRPPPAKTGVPINTELYWAIGLLLGGGLVLMAGVRRRKVVPITEMIDE